MLIINTVHLLLLELNEYGIIDTCVSCFMKNSIDFGISSVSFALHLSQANFQQKP